MNADKLGTGKLLLGLGVGAFSEMESEILINRMSPP